MHWLRSGTTLITSSLSLSLFTSSPRYFRSGVVSSFANAATMATNSDTIALNIPDLTLGFLGTGKISSCMVRGYAGSGACAPRRIIISPRNEEKALALKEEFPELVTIASSNEQVVSEADVIFIGLLPAVAREVLPVMPFSAGKKFVVSMMAAVDLAEIRALCGDIPADRFVRTVPLPSSARRQGPILTHPKIAVFDSILSVVGTPVTVDSEAEMKPLICLTGHISSFFELMKTTEEFMVHQGVEPRTARTYVSSFYSSLAQGTETSHETLADMAIEACTPGGINEQCMRILQTTDHYPSQTKTLTAILKRLQGLEPYIPLPKTKTEE